MAMKEGRIFVRCKKILLHYGWEKVTWQKYTKGKSVISFQEKEIVLYDEVQFIHMRHSVYELIGVLIVEGYFPFEMTVSDVMRMAISIR